MAKEEKIDINELKRNFNIIPKVIEENLEYGEYFNHSKYWTEKILKMSFYLLVGSVICFLVGCLFFVTKPRPFVYGSQSNNELYRLQTLTHSEAIRMVNESKAQRNSNAAVPNNGSAVPNNNGAGGQK